MGCICATATDEYHGWRCSITDGACLFLQPNQDACADEYGEVEHTEKWLKNKEEKRQVHIDQHNKADKMKRNGLPTVPIPIFIRIFNNYNRYLL